MWTSLSTLVEVAFIWIAIYGFLRFLRGSHGKAVVSGFTMVLFAVMGLFAVFHGFSVLETTFPAIAYIAGNMGLAFGFGTLILLQPELRYALTNLGQRRMRHSEAKNEIQRYTEVAQAARHLSERKCGALMALQRSIGLRAWSETGIPLDCYVRSEILSAIFEGTSSIHDGAAIILGDRIVSAGCLLPLSEDPEIASQLGTRHRAGIGLSERSDALVVIVSEETGRIGLATDGNFDLGPRGRGLTEDELRNKMLALMMGKAKR